jgi:hypothetical protein
MTQYRFPQDRATFVYGQDYDPILTPPRTAIVVYEDELLTTPAGITDLVGTPIALSTLYTVAGLVPEFLGPDGRTRLWTGSQGAAYPLDAQATSLLENSGVGGTARQLWATGVAASALSGHRVVTPAPDGLLDYASNNDPGDVNAPLWVTASAASQGSAVEALMFGSMIEPTWTWTPSQPVYLGTNGVLTQTPPAAPGAAFLAQVGMATSPISLFVDRSPSIKII